MLDPEFARRLNRAMQASVFDGFNPQAVLSLAALAGDFEHLPAEFRDLVLAAEKELGLADGSR